MQTFFIQYVFLILIILALVMLARRIKVAYPIVLLLGGVLLSFTSIFSKINIDPEVVFYISLPPLLYEASWQTSWKEFYRWRRVIMSFAFPIVIITACVIAYSATAIIPGFTLALGFLLGGIISPPDAVSATTIMRGVKVPKSLLTILEGESLLNDASSLIVLRFALAAIITGQFNLGEATGTFFVVVLMGTVIGLLVGLVFYAIHRLLPTTTSIEIVLTLVAPYCMFFTAEQFHFSGVLAVVSGGLLLSSKRHSMLNYRSRIEGVNVWTNVVFVLNGLIFLLIGLQLPTITRGLGNISLMTAVWYGLAISGVLILTRFVCTFGASIFTRVVSRFITVADPNPGWKTPLVTGWAGMRGVVSLAAALSIPVTINNSQAFPYRNLILFITFIVILVTLVLQGLTIPWLIRRVKIDDKFNPISEQEQELILQKKMAKVSLQYLDEKHGNNKDQNKYLVNLLGRLELDLNAFQEDVKELSEVNDNTLMNYHRILLDLLEHQRNTLHEMNRGTEINEELIRKYLALIDLDEFKIRERLLVK